jgi:Hemerythrin HHE cation binding domain
MDFQNMLTELFHEEDRARAMAARLMHAAQSSRAAAISERDSLLEFLRGPMERHIAYEERELFPQLERLGLSPEVQVACKHHASIREAAEKLASASEDAVPQLVFDVGRLMLHHTNFEGDYIYPELTLEAWQHLMEETIH